MTIRGPNGLVTEQLQFITNLMTVTSMILPSVAITVSTPSWWGERFNMFQHQDLKMHFLYSHLQLGRFRTLVSFQLSLKSGHCLPMAHLIPPWPCFHFRTSKMILLTRTCVLLVLTSYTLLKHGITNFTLISFKLLKVSRILNPWHASGLIFHWP